MDRVYKLRTTKIEAMSAANVQWMSSSNAFLVVPDRDFVIRDDGRASTFRDLFDVGQVIGVPMRDQDVIRSHFLT